MSSAVDLRRGLGPSLLWLWYRPAAAAPMQLLAWELPYAEGVAQKKKKKERKKEKLEIFIFRKSWHCYFFIVPSLIL